MTQSESVRRVLLIAHTGRDDARRTALEVCDALTRHGLVVRLLDDEARDLGLAVDDHALLEATDSADDAGRGCELALIIGGDGTLLRAAEITRDSPTPLLAINLGHVGFLAEAEYDDTDSVIAAVVSRDYTLEQRLTIDVTVTQDGAPVASTFALNEATVEKGARKRMLQVVVEIDGRPVSRWGCDGVVCSTPTGSTAYNFSAGGPIVWPEVEAMLLVPISAHALFARPMVVAPTSVVAIEVLSGNVGAGVLWCDGRRTTELPRGARIEIRRGAVPVTLVRLQEATFADTLVAKFDLPVEGWRGAAERRRRNGGADDA